MKKIIFNLLLFDVTYDIRICKNTTKMKFLIDQKS